LSTVFIDVGTSLDGFIAGPNGRAGNPLGDGGLAIHDWMFPLRAFHELLGMTGGDTGPNNDVIQEILNRTGVSIMGRNMFNEGEVAWPENAPFRTPVFVMTHEQRAPWQRPGGTTFYFVNDSPAAVLERAKGVANGKDIRISGGANTIQQFLRAGLVDEIAIHIAPLLLGRGVSLFGELGAERVKIAPIAATFTPEVTHLRYRVVK
jgi:dihydrofolate reductase